ncbi:MAG: hypothetical protein GEU94_08770 [Micromonosporaceae bacterium]|nr:hypothetical protein [Micromonosporaceae bacterium]
MADVTLPVDPSPETTIVLPIGHYVGAHYPGPGEPLEDHTVRIGATPVHLLSDEEFGVWVLAHGLAGPDAEAPWTRRHLLDAAAEASVDDAPELLEELLEEGVVAEVALGTTESVEFAKEHRVAPLMAGMGLVSEDPVAVRIGVYGIQTAEVNGFAFELWRLGHRAGSLWDFCQMQGAFLRDETGLSAADSTPEKMLLMSLLELQTLLASNAVYLDTLSP